MSSEFPDLFALPITIPNLGGTQEGGNKAGGGVHSTDEVHHEYILEMLRKGRQVKLTNIKFDIYFHLHNEHQKFTWHFQTIMSRMTRCFLLMEQLRTTV